MGWTITASCSFQMDQPQSILCHPGEMTNEIILTESPRLPMVIDPDRYVKTLYTVVESSEADKQAFMLTEMVTE